MIGVPQGPPPEDVDAVVDEAGGLYDRIKAHDPADRSCDYLFSR